MNKAGCRGLRIAESPTGAPRGMSVARRSSHVVRRSPRSAFTLIELLIVVAIISILAAIATVNLRQASERAHKSADAANLRAIAAALQNYLVDYGSLPPADREAGPFMSHTPDYAMVRNGPAGGGSWDGLPWLLVEYGYISDPKTMFCPKYLKLYRGGKTIRGDHPRYHNFRYAYNSAGLASGGHAGGDGNVMSGERWIVRDLFVAANKGWFHDRYPEAPADYKFPWGEGEWEGQLEHVMYADFAVRTVIGGTDQSPDRY